MIRTGYCEVKNLLSVEMEGMVGLNEVIEYCEQILSDDSLPLSLRILENATSAEFDFSIDEIRELNQVIRQHVGNNRSIKHALLRDKPMETAFAMMQEHENSMHNYNPKVFSTEQGALQWLLNDRI